jgi:hypothetical protein
MDAPRLRSLLLRGSVVVTANWPVVVAQAIAESVVKALAGIPVAGAGLLLLLVSVPEDASTAAALAALATRPVALAGVALSALIAGAGGIVFGAVIKGGTIAVLVEGDARARPLDGAPLRLADLRAAHAWSRARFMDGCRRAGARVVRLGLAFACVEAAIALGYATAVVQAYRGFVSIAASWWIPPVVAAVSLLALAASIVADLVYRLAQLVLVMDGVPRVRDAVRGAVALIRRQPLAVARVCLAALVLTIMVFVATLIAAAAFGLVSFVPVAGVAVLPLQAAVWVVRGLALPFIDQVALAAFVALARSSPAASEPEVSRAPSLSPASS